jgi:hypothetical protein
MELENQSTSGTSDKSKEFQQKCCTALNELKLGYDIEDPDDGYSSQWAFSKLCGRILGALLVGENVSDPWWHSANDENRYKSDPDFYYGTSREYAEEEWMNLAIEGGPYLPDFTVQEELDYNHAQLPMPRRKG